MPHAVDSSRPLHAGMHAVSHRTFRLLTRSGVALNVAALVALDRNRDCALSGDELDGLLAWSDDNEDGEHPVDGTASSEITIAAAALARLGLQRIRAIDYGLHTVGVQPRPRLFVQMPVPQPDAYAQLRHGDNAYFPLCRVGGHEWVWRSSDIKINQGQPDSLIGTDAADTMDAASYAVYLGARAVYFDLGLLSRFYAGAGNDVFGGSVRNDWIWGGTGDDVLSGYAGDDYLYGEHGADALHGDSGDDILFGGPDNDCLYGGPGKDTLYGGTGDDTLVGFSVEGEVPHATDAPDRFNDRLYGGAGNDALHGGFGADYLDGGSGVDSMDGGPDNDTYVVNCAADRVTEHGDGGYDTVISTVSFVLPEHVEALRLLDGLDIHGIGNGLDNRIIGNSRNNLLDGGAGADVLVGGEGDDTYVVDHPADQPREYLNEGIDTVQSRISYTLGPHLEHLTLLDAGALAHATAKGTQARPAYLAYPAYPVYPDYLVEPADPADPLSRWNPHINGTGNAQANWLIGNAGDNLLAGGRGNDYLYGGGGHDTYVFARGDGVDTIFDADSNTDTIDSLLLPDTHLTQLWLEQIDLDLHIRVLGSSDRIVVAHWYAAGENGDAHPLERIQMANGQVVLHTEVNRLVQAMAALARPAATQTHWYAGQGAWDSLRQALSFSDSPGRA